MDPLTIANTSAALVVTCARLSEYIYSLFDKTRNVDNAVRILHVEIDSLSRVLRAINSNFGDQSMAKVVLSAQTGHELQHWDNVWRSMKDCEESLGRLEREIKKLNKGDSLSGSLWRPTKKMIKMGMKSETIQLLKQEITCYRQTMHLSLQLISVSSDLNSEAHNAKMDSKIDALKGDLQKVLQLLAGQTESSNLPESSATNLEACIASAKKFVSSAANIVHERSVGGSVADRSDRGEPLIEERQEQIHSWILEQTRFVEDPEELSPTSSTNNSDGTISSAASNAIFSPTETIYTDATSPISGLGGRKFEKLTSSGCNSTFIDGTNQAAVERDPSFYLKSTKDTESIPEAMTSSLQPALHIDTQLAVKRAIEPRPKSFDICPEIGDDVLNETWMTALDKLNKREFTAAESLLEVELKEREARYGSEFDGKSKLLGLLASASAQHGKRERVEEILDTVHLEKAGWRHIVLCTLISTLLEEGRVGQASELWDKYGSEFEGKDDALKTLLSVCLKHRVWSVINGIFNKYLSFRARDSMLKECVSVTRRDSCWDEAEGFLIELLKVEQPEIELSAFMHMLAEVYFAKMEFNSAREQCRQALNIRSRRLGKQHPFVLESRYLFAKILYEAAGDTHEYVFQRDQLPQKLQVELLSRMHCTQASQQLGTSLLTNLNRTPSSESLTSKYVDLDSVRQTIKTHGVIGATVLKGDILLHVFSECGNEIALQSLLDAGARINTYTKSGRTALYLAVEKGHDRVLEVLLKNNAPVDGQDSPDNPLFLAATNGRVTAVNLLLKYREGPSQWPAPDMLYQTAARGYVDVLQILLANGAQDIPEMKQNHSSCFRDPAPAIRVRTALHEAVARSFPSRLVDLLSNNVNIKVVDRRGALPLHEAVLHSDVDTVRVLLTNGIKLSPKANSEGRTFPQRGASTFEEIMSPSPTTSSAREGGTYIDAVDDTGNTPLHLALFKDEPDPKVLKLLLEYGADVNGTDRLTKRGIVEAVKGRTEKSAEIVCLLLEFNADLGGLKELGFSFEDYQSAVGGTAATEIMKKLSVPQRRNTEKVDQGSSLTLLRPRSRWLRPIRTPTTCV